MKPFSYDRNDPCKASCQLQSTWDAVLYHYAGDCTLEKDPKLDRYYNHIDGVTRRIQKLIKKSSGQTCANCNRISRGFFEGIVGASLGWQAGLAAGQIHGGHMLGGGAGLMVG